MCGNPDPLNQLEGTDLQNGWTLGPVLRRRPDLTGGHFSVGYSATHTDGRNGFVKALDFNAALNEPDITGALQRLTEEYNFERDLSDRLTRKVGKRVINCLAHGQINVVGVPLGKVFYLIFELAESDLRKLYADAELSLHEIIKSVRSVALSLDALHRNQVCHQDIKPSNILSFSEREVMKLGDLGRSWSNEMSNPIDELFIACQYMYAPADRLYGSPHKLTLEDRRFADIYALGTLGILLLSGVVSTTTMQGLLALEHRSPYLSDSSAWYGDFAGVLPYLRQAHAELGILVEERTVGNSAGEEALVLQKAVRLFLALCHPNPVERGDIKARLASSRPSSDLSPFISRLAVLEKRSGMLARA